MCIGAVRWDMHINICVGRQGREMRNEYFEFKTLRSTNPLPIQRRRVSGDVPMVHLLQLEVPSMNNRMAQHWVHPSPLQWPTSVPVPVKPWFWKSCVDDTCYIMKCTVEVLLDHLNSMWPSIQFIVEAEKDERLLFLDTLLQGKDNGIKTQENWNVASQWSMNAWSGKHAQHIWWPS